MAIALRLIRFSEIIKFKMTAQEKAQAFLKSCELYQLGGLTTEQRHPLTMELSQWSNTDLERAVMSLVKVDLQALSQFHSYAESLQGVRTEVQGVLREGGRVFLCGCGATGRLSLLNESLWREAYPMSEQVQAFMAGGDVALVHSLEGFEDYPEYGARHLKEMGFQDGDLLVASTEGGETPYVIGATEAAVEISQRKPYFLYCNPDRVLRAKVDRSRRVLDNDSIRKLNLEIGPMGLSGSTRMQASTVLQLAVGFSLMSDIDLKTFIQELKEAAQLLEENAFVFLEDFIKHESMLYREGAYLLYHVYKDYLTIFTDTTERAPTFSLAAFGNHLQPKTHKWAPSRCYISLPDEDSAQGAWLRLLRRPPRSLNWLNVDARTSDEYLMAFDFGKGAQAFRQKELQGKEQESFYISRSEEAFEWKLLDAERSLMFPQHWHPVIRTAVLKMLLNIHSTLVMGRIGRYRNNVMTHVHPTNGKLIDRAVRYIRSLLEDQGVNAPYEDVVNILFEEIESVKPGEAIVEKCLGRYEHQF